MQGSVEIPGATALYLTFDKACRLEELATDEAHKGDFCLYLDNERTRVLAKMSGGPESFRPIIVPGSRVFYTLSTTAQLPGACSVKMFTSKLDTIWLEVCAHTVACL